MNIKYKKCLGCGKDFTNIRKGDGKLLGDIQFNKTKSCSHLCGIKTKFRSNKFTFKRDKCFICIGDNEVIIDKDEFNKVESYRWFIDSEGYGSTHPRKGLHNNNKSVLRLHNLIMGYKTGLVVDHINGNKLDNRKSNLRHVSHSKNTFNSERRSKHVGVYFYKRTNRYHAEIMYKYKKIHLGSSVHLAEAIELRKIAELKYFGELSRCYSK
jgi:hypothetical protein